MAHRIITQVVITGARVFGRAFAEAYKQANATRVTGSQAGSGSSPLSSKSGITLDEACKILNVSPPKQGKADMDHIMERFKRLFDQNEPKKGGSFYLQSKILRARERIEAEVRNAAEKVEREAELKEGWKPKVYKNQ